MSRVYCVYILASRSRNLYIGVTNDLDRRTIEHRLKLVSGFASRYRIFRLVHFERFGDIRQAIDREKEIKGWRREKKIRLIESHNPTWSDLAEHLPAKDKKADPSHRSPKAGERVRDDTQATKHKPIAPTPTRVIPNHAMSQIDVTPTPRRTTPVADVREGSAFSSALPKSAAKP